MKEFIDKLQSIDAKEVANYLKSIDLKDIDLDRIKEVLLRKPDLLISIILALVTVFSCVKIVGGNSQTIKQIKTEVSEKEEKIVYADKNAELKSEYETLLANFPEPLSTSKLISLLNEFALKHDVRIENFSPTKTVEDDYRKLIMLNIDVAASSYANVIMFIQSIENSKYAIRIQKWLGGLEGSAGSNSRRNSRMTTQQNIADQDKLLKINLEISSIELKKDD